MATYVISLVIPDVKTQKRLQLIVKGCALSVHEKDGQYVTSMEDDGNRRKLETALADFNSSVAHLTVMRDGSQLNLAGKSVV